MKGLIPCAGQGTRLRPLSLAVPKELLPLGLKPAIHFSVLDITHGGINHIVLVINRHKTRIADYLRAAFPDVHFTFHVQEEPRGLGFAMLEAKPYLEHAPFVMVLPDNIFVGQKSLTTSLRQVHERTRKCCVTLFRDGRIKPGACVGMEVQPLESDADSLAAMYPISEVPDSVDVYSGPAAYLFTPRVFDFLAMGLQEWDPSERDYSEGPALRRLIEAGKVCAAWVEGTSFDLGTPEGYLNCLKYFVKLYDNSPVSPKG